MFTISAPVAVEIATFVPSTKRFLPIPTPPDTTREPVSLLVESLVAANCVWPVIFTVLLTLTLLLNVVGPSKEDRMSPESPPSTTILSLTVTSSNTALNLAGVSPVTVGIGVSNVDSSPVADDFFWFPI